ncbi:hypothetical protein KFK09_005304 [Dendrobium nobile]|uniref:Origin recognition complex subunit 5 n=1 Tax=Dendrobium nobile TaxID=94219 RepID=A0A8T3C0K7_DENNO|nr:hypothetical protein KFK09_005304 [Dendrobium nobile]
MAKDGVIPLSPGIRTRSSSHLSPSKPSPQNVCPFSSQTQSQELIHCLYCSEEPISLATLISSIPGRKKQILEILRLVGSLNSPMFLLLIYGGTSNGKTISILQIFRYLNRPFVYAGFRTCYSPRILFDSVLRQLLLHARNPIKGNSGTKRCEKLSEFIDLLKLLWFRR